MIRRILHRLRMGRIERQTLITEQWQSAHENYPIESYRLRKEAEETKLERMKTAA